MFEKNCPYCEKPISVFSKGVMKGAFSCPHCNKELRSRPGIVGIAIACGIGGAISVALHWSGTITVPVAMGLSYPFAIRLVKK